MIRKLISVVGAKLKAEATFLVLLAVAGVGAWLYVQFQQVRADRDRLAHWAEVTCAASGAPFAASEAEKRAGKACRDRVGELAGFKANSDQRTAQLLADAMAEQAARQTRDTQAARAAAEAARSAAIRLEAADAEAERTNLVDREWFAAVNGVAGLRATRAPAN